MIGPELSTLLRCPLDGGELHADGGRLVCTAGHVYPVVQGIPVMLADDPDPTLWVMRASREAAAHAAERPADDRFIDTLGISDAERAKLATLPEGPVDPVVSMIIPGTSGHLYAARQGRYASYPIPELRLPAASGELFLEIGCNWGRWCIAAARKGYRVVGIDPSLGAVLAAKRVAAQLGVEAEFVVADARRLPFVTRRFDVVFSYSVLQHFAREDVERTLDEIARVLKSGGVSFIQLANALGVRSLYHQARRGFRDQGGFDVRYWRIADMRRVLRAGDWALCRQRGRLLRARYPEHRRGAHAAIPPPRLPRVRRAEGRERAGARAGPGR